MNGRSQCIAVDGEESEWCPVTSGVSQGSVLFLIFINDITDGASSNMILCADDSVIYRKLTSLEDQKALHKGLVRVFI